MGSLNKPPKKNSRPPELTYFLASDYNPQKGTSAYFESAKATAEILSQPNTFVDGEIELMYPYTALLKGRFDSVIDKTKSTLIPNLQIGEKHLILYACS